MSASPIIENVVSALRDALRYVPLNATHDATRAALAAYDAEAPVRPRIACYVSGGNLQTVMASEQIDVAVIDADNIENRQAAQARWATVFAGLEFNVY